MHSFWDIGFMIMWKLKYSNTDWWFTRKPNQEQRMSISNRILSLGEIPFLSSWEIIFNTLTSCKCWKTVLNSKSVEGRGYGNISLGTLKCVPGRFEILCLMDRSPISPSPLTTGTIGCPSPEPRKSHPEKNICIQHSWKKQHSSTTCYMIYMKIYNQEQLKLFLIIEFS